MLEQMFMELLKEVIFQDGKNRFLFKLKRCIYNIFVVKIRGNQQIIGCTYNQICLQIIRYSLLCSWDEQENIIYTSLKLGSN